MNTLRNSLVCRASRIKQLIGLMTLLLLCPTFASAACLPSRVCWVTSGTPFTINQNDPSFSLNFAGKDFSASGVLTDACCMLPFGLFFNFESDPFEEAFGGSVNQLAQFDLTVKGVPWVIPAGGDASVSFFADLGNPAFPPFGGTYSVPFDFQGAFKGAPEPFPAGLGCDMLNCQTLNFRGGGVVTIEVVGPLFGTDFFQVESETFTFLNAPEPSTASLLLVALAGLAVMGRRVRSLAPT
jgi:hypothetical protein